MSKYQIVTTMNESGYNLYGKKMLESFVKRWPNEQSIVVYVEGFDLDREFRQDSRVISRDLVKCSTDLVEFKNRHRDNRAAHGYVDPTRRDADFAFNAVRFSHKVFALYHAVHNRTPDTQAIIWMDADTYTHAAVPSNFLETHFPLTENIGIYYLGRKEQHSECGWMVFNCQNAHMKTFWKRFVNQYRQDELFNLKEWHDSFVFDHVRETMEKTAGMVNSNITPNYVRGHPFIDSFLGEYMDHLKGPKRKLVGRSAKSEAKNKTASWWR